VPVTMSYHASHLVSLLTEDPTLVALLDIKRPLGMTAGDPGMYRAGSHVKSCLSAAIMMVGRTDMDHY
jgi:hypothetical protein